MSDPYGSTRAERTLLRLQNRTPRTADEKERARRQAATTAVINEAHKKQEAREKDHDRAQDLLRVSRRYKANTAALPEAGHGWVEIVDQMDTGHMDRTRYLARDNNPEPSFTPRNGALHNTLQEMFAQYLDMQFYNALYHLKKTQPILNNVLVYRYSYFYSQRETAKLMSVSKSTIMNWERRALAAVATLCRESYTAQDVGLYS